MSSPWGHLVLRRESGGNRHYLCDRPIRCGAPLQLRTVRVVYDRDRDEEFLEQLEGVVEVTYEADLLAKNPTVTLYATLGGHRAVVLYHSRMQLRWPDER